MVQEDQNDSPWERAAVETITPKNGSAAQILHGRIRGYQARRPGQPVASVNASGRSSEKNRELRKANDIPHLAMYVFCPSRTRLPSEVLRAFFDQHRHPLAIESICRALQITPYSYRNHEARLRSTALCSCRGWPDDVLSLEPRRVCLSEPE